MTNNLSNNVSRKFIEQFDISNWEVETESGYVDIISTNKTIEYQVYEVVTESGLTLECADTHILITKDNEEVFAKDSLNVIIKTKFGPDKVISVNSSDIYENMYDLSIDSDNHTYYTNNILSHNTITTAAYFLWVVIFNSDKNIAILANKAAMAREILSRIQFAYENLPFWIQQGIVEWNKGSIKLDNNSKIFTAATSPNSIRGSSATHVYCVAGDTKITIRNYKETIITNINEFDEKLNPDEWEVLTSSGFKSFSKLRKTKADKLLHIKFSDNSEIKVTKGHRLLSYNNNWLNSESCKPRQKLLSNNSSGYISVTSISLIAGSDVYDLVDVSDISSYYTNNVISHNCDELAFIPNNIAEEFLTSVFPVLSSGKETKIFVSSTPKGMNIFYKMWVDAEAGRNGFVPVRVNWKEHPDRDQNWYDEQVKNLGPVKSAQEIDCSFIGSSKLLLSGEKLATIPFFEPIFTQNNLKMYEKPIKGHSYICTVDTSRGQHLDFSAFIIFDITTTPYKVVATFKDNTIGLMTYPYMIMNTLKQYNDAYCLIEINDAGQEIANTIFYEFEYSNVYFTFKEQVTEGSGYPGVRTTKRTKSIGCAVLKELIEGDQLQVISYDIIKELNVFEQKGASYAAADVSVNDDLTTCLILFAWITKQSLFADITNINIRHILAQKNEEYILANLTPFGLIVDGLEEHTMYDINALPSKSGNALLDWVNS